MDVETVRMSSKGQIVIPQDVREQLHADEGTIFAIVGSGDTVILKKITTPSTDELIKDLSRFAKKAKLKLQSKGITEKDLQVK
mgnify:CR=1 FL=1